MEPWLAATSNNSTVSACHRGDSDLGVAFGSILFVGIGLSYVSQHVKLLRTRSTVGLSWVMLFVANVSNFCSLLNVIVLSHTFGCCSLASTSSRECYELFLPLLQIGMPSLNLVPIFVVFLCLWRPDPTLAVTDREGKESRLRRLMRWADANEAVLSRAAFGVFAVVFLVGFSTIAAVLTLVPGAGDAVSFAEALGGVASVSNMLQWLPQIFSTLRSGKVGSLSILMLALQVPGGLAVVIFNTVVEPSSITTWGPFVLSAAQQFVLLVICLVFSVRDYREKNKEVGNVSSSEETAALLLNN